MNQNWDYNYDGGGATYSRPNTGATPAGFAASCPDSGAGYFFIRDTSPRYPVSKRYMDNTPVSHETIIANQA